MNENTINNVNVDASMIILLVLIITSFNGVTMGYLEKNLTQEQTQYQAHYSGINLQTNNKYSVTEVGESSNGFIVNQQVEESPIGLSLSKSTPVVNRV
uniref:Uncharacterized protein n=1 Tax=Tanacetum cinerariifolium TaxID=118510 RepID=A0A699HZR5_TANCI|nr:hypothetical protein [Tanacetum cinerariifolium]